MKNVFLLSIFFALTFISCEKDEAIRENALQLTKHPSWNIERLREGFMTPFIYTIQFPPDYEGGLFIGLEGNTFHKSSIDEKVTLEYSFCGDVGCADYGSYLDNNNDLSVSATIKDGEKLILTKRKNIYDKDNIVGIYYYNDHEKSMGKLFWLFGVSFDNIPIYAESLTVHYDKAFQREVEQIITTIAIE